MAKGIVRTDNVQATKSGNIKSARYYVTSTATEIENGNIVVLAGLLSTANREIFKAIAPANVAAKNVYLVATPELIYSEELKSDGALGNFTNAAGENITLIGLEAGDIFSVSDECFNTVINDADDKPAAGNYAIIDANTTTKFAEVASLSGSEGFICEIIARELFKKDVYLNVLQVIAN